MGLFDKNLTFAFNVHDSWLHKRWRDDLKPPKKLGQEHKVVALERTKELIFFN